MARFEREAQVLASLNHPNIASITGSKIRGACLHSSWSSSDGQTLAERIERGPIDIEQAIAIAKQIAEGLEAAHEKGIIHRDLKPANANDHRRRNREAPRLRVSESARRRHRPGASTTPAHQH